jgi:hypothetical protein
MHGEARLVMERPQLGPVDRGLLPGKRRHDAMIAANDERKVSDDVVDRHQLAAGFFSLPETSLPTAQEL